MLFNSFTFILFFAIVLMVSRLCTSWTLRKSFLLLVSYLFYAAWNPPFVLLLWLSTVGDWFFAKWMHQTDSVRRRRIWLCASLVLNLGMLSYFKYAGVALENFCNLMGIFGIDYAPAATNIILPVGISFYTFQTLSYTLDVYRRQAKPWHSFLDYALFVTFFPQLVAGPIVRAVDFLPQCDPPRQATWRQIGWGLTLFVIGLFNKVVIADDMLSETVQKIYDAQAVQGFVDAWVATLAFSVQIFCDFAGYSTCAIGVAMCLGFSLPDNFRFPYASMGFGDFWKRWHISLSSWLRDYLYIPLGGNRNGRSRTEINLIVTMLLGGLWHGASWTFVIWGALHGAYLMLEHRLRRRYAQAAIATHWAGQLAIMALTYFGVCLAWVFFRAKSFDQAVGVLRGLFGFDGWRVSDDVNAGEILPVVGIALLLHYLLRNVGLERAASYIPPRIRGFILAVMVYMIFSIMFRLSNGM